MCGGGVGRPGFQLEPLQHLRGTSASPHPCVSRQPGVSSLSLSVGFRGLQGHDATDPINPPPPTRHANILMLPAEDWLGGRMEEAGRGNGSLPPQRPQFGGEARLRDQAVGGKEPCFLEGGDQN